MTSNRKDLVEVRLTMPGIEQSDFIREKIARLQSAATKAINQGRESSPRYKIQRVSSVLRDIKADFQRYFEPRLVALGPLHHDNPKFERSEQVKRQFAAHFAQQNETTGEDLFNKIKAEIEYLRTYYDQNDISNYNDDELAWMFFVDGCAVLYAVYHGSEGDFEKLNIKADRLVFAQLDLFLLENQLPYRVLEILIQSAKVPEMWKKSVTKFIGNNLITNIPSGKKGQHTEEELEEEKEKQDYVHLLERLRKKLLTGLVEKSSSSLIGGMFLACGDNPKNRKTFRSIKELKESAGIIVRPSNSNNLRNISFYCNFLGSLRMPRFLVDDSTASKLLNLVALEMCLDFENDFAVTSYLCFLDSLIDTAEDVKELRVAGVLHSYLGSDKEVAVLFNRMSRDLVPDQGIYSDVMENIHKYCNNPWTSAMAQAYYTHFSSPWTFLAFFAALLGLLFSAIQAYYSLFPHGNNRERD